MAPAQGTAVAPAPRSRLRSLSLRTKLFGFAGVCVVAVAAVIGLSARQTGQARDVAAQECGTLSAQDTAHALTGAYALCLPQQESQDQMIAAALRVAGRQLEALGGFRPSARETTEWAAVNQFSRQSSAVSLPKAMLGKTWVGRNRTTAAPSPLVDDVRALTGLQCTLFQRMNPAGDMLRVATTHQTDADTRAVGTFIPRTNPDGTANPVVASLLAGQTYRGRARVLADWYIAAYQPVTGPDGAVTGALYVGIPQENVPGLRAALRKVEVGASGRAFVLDTQGTVVVSADPAEEGRSVFAAGATEKEVALRDLCERARTLKPGEAAEKRCEWAAGGERRAQVVRFAYFAPWDWVIGVHVPEDEARAAERRISEAGARTQAELYVVGGLACLVALGCAGWLARSVTRPIADTVRVLEAVARGDLTRTAEVTAADEVGRLAAALNTAIGNMRADVGEMARVRSMMEQAPINVMFADRQLVVRYANPATIKTLKSIEHLLPIKAEDLVGQSIDIFHKRPEHQRRMLADPKNLPHRANITVGPETLDLLVSPVLDQDRNYLGAMVTWEVVTQKLAAEKQIRDAAEREATQAAELRRKVEAVQAGVSALAAGDFTRQIPDLGTDGVGQVAAGLNRAVATVRTALEGVREVSDQLADASAQLAAASDEISAGAQEQASSLEETASTLEEITATVRQNSDAAQQARQLASGSKDVAEKGGQVVGSAVGAMGEINQSSKKIADIITTIDEIAFQTNLLALNAAVEAARAGEQGRGFAVVAAEVRNLAQRSATAAKEIKGLIQDSVKKVGAGTDLVNRSGSTLDEIVTSVKRVTDIVTEIAAASREQSTGIDQVNKAVTQMDAVTQRNAGQTEELSATAQTLTGQASQLRELVARFKLSEAAVPAHPPAAPARTARPAPKPRAAKAGHTGGRPRTAAHGDGFTEF